MKIEFDTELSLYKVTLLENNLPIYIVAPNFKDLHKDLIENKHEPSKIELMDFEVYICKSILKQNL